jgi:thiosulfate/3-mercaptopyruvate sulfurtransferase
MLPADKLTDIFADQSVSIELPTISSCGSGVTANIPLLALYLLGNTNAAVYDGSWNDWGAQADTLIETGVAQINYATLAG